MIFQWHERGVEVLFAQFIFLSETVDGLQFEHMPRHGVPTVILGPIFTKRVGIFNKL